MLLGTCADGRTLTYDQYLYEFRLDRSVARYEDVRDLDTHAHITWRAPEQRDWFHHIKAADLAACNARELARRGGDAYAGMTPEERVEADAARDDSVLAGKIVDADPALVQAVVAALEDKGLLSGTLPGQPFVVNPLASADLPKGMEPLSQLTRQQTDRKMTPNEKRLMQKILKNDDKAKVKREKDETLAETDAKKEAAQIRKEEEHPAPPKSRVTSDAMNMVAEQGYSSSESESAVGAQTRARVAQTTASVAATRPQDTKAARQAVAVEASSVPGMDTAKKQKRFKRKKRQSDGTPDYGQMGPV